MIQQMEVIQDDDPRTNILVERLVRFYHSEYVALCRPEVRAVPAEEWIKRQLAGKGMIVQ